MPSKTQSVIVAAFVYVVLGLAVNILLAETPVGGVLGCLILFTAGIVAVWHYTSTHSLTISGGQGAGIGTIATVAGVLISMVLGFILVEVGFMPDPAVIAEAQMDQAIADMESRGMSEEDIDRALSFGRMFTQPGFMLLFGLAAGAIGGAISGAVSALIFKKGSDAEEF